MMSSRNILLSPSPLFRQFFSCLCRQNNNLKPNPKLCRLLWIYPFLMDLPQQLKAVTLTHVRYRRGVVVGASWFWVVNSVLYPYFPVIEESALGRMMLYVKDTSHIPDVLKFEYDNARAARKNMEDAKSV